ncbi:MAG: ribokinase, partial [Halocynthiibacter sp.]
MTIFNLGSINTDYIYEVPHLPRPGETLAATGFGFGLGGKGANQSVAAAQAGSAVIHIGAVGADGGWAKKRLADYGVDVRHIAETDIATGHAIVCVDRAAENAIVVFAGANMAQAETAITAALGQGKAGDLLLLQNETSHQVFAARLAHEKGMKVFYSAAPFSVDATASLLPYLSILALNSLEADQFSAGLETNLSDLGLPGILVTRGADGAEWHAGKNVITSPAIPVEPVDTTGAGDTFAGYFAASIDQGIAPQRALRLATESPFAVQHGRQRHAVDVRRRYECRGSSDLRGIVRTP